MQLSDIDLGKNVGRIALLVLALIASLSACNPFSSCEDRAIKAQTVGMLLGGANGRQCGQGAVYGYLRRSNPDGDAPVFYLVPDKELLSKQLIDEEGLRSVSVRLDFSKSEYNTELPSPCTGKYVFVLGQIMKVGSELVIAMDDSSVVVEVGVERLRYCDRGSDF